MEKNLFDIPIYRCSPEQHKQEMDVIRKKWVMMDGREIREHEIIFFENNFNYSWQFNEVIGWLRLYFYHSLQIDCWMIKKRKINKGILKKEFIYTERFTEIFIDVNKCPEEITEEICRGIKNKAKSYGLANRYIDFSSFKIIGRCTDWKRLRQHFNYIDVMSSTVS